MDKTIRMPADLLAKWLAALRSGEYKQGKNALRTIAGGYCCLGVLQHQADGCVEVTEDGVPEGLPSREWLTAHGIFFRESSEFQAGTAVSPFLPKFKASAFSVNDGGSASFTEIADAIEACAEGY